MGGFTVSRSYTMNRDEVREIAEDLARQIESQYGVTARWQGDTVSMRGSGVDGTLAIDDEVVRVKVKVGGGPVGISPGVPLTEVLAAHCTLLSGSGADSGSISTREYPPPSAAVDQGSVSS